MAMLLRLNVQDILFFNGSKFENGNWKMEIGNWKNEINAEVVDEFVEKRRINPNFTSYQKRV